MCPSPSLSPSHAPSLDHTGVLTACHRPVARCPPYRPFRGCVKRPGAPGRRARRPASRSVTFMWYEGGDLTLAL